MAEETWTIRRVLEWTRGYLENKGDEKARLSAEWLLGDATGLSRVQLYTNYDKPLTKDELARMHALIERRAAGEPLQYVTGEMPFRHIIVRCESGVLIPRPETEVLVDKVLEWLDATDDGNASDTDNATDAGDAADTDDSRGASAPTAEHRLILDLCTGTGCIALSIAHERANTQLIATDIAPEAIKLATRNAEALDLQERVSFIECDLASGVADELRGHIEVIVSNPPYIPSKLVDQLPSEVSSFEPHLALDGGADGLDLFRRIIEVAPHMLKSGGLLACELHEESLEQAADLMSAQGVWTDVSIHKDLAERPRIITAVLA